VIQGARADTERSAVTGCGRRFEEELKSFNDLNAEKTGKHFRDFLAMKDVTHFWRPTGPTL